MLEATDNTLTWTTKWPENKHSTSERNSSCATRGRLSVETPVAQSQFISVRVGKRRTQVIKEIKQASPMIMIWHHNRTCILNALGDCSGLDFSWEKSGTVLTPPSKRETIITCVFRYTLNTWLSPTISSVLSRGPIRFPTLNSPNLQC